MSKKKNFKDNIFVLIISLAIIAAIAASILAVVDYVTRKPRAAASLNATLDAFRQLQPYFNNDPLEDRIYLVKNGENWQVLDDKNELSKYGNDAVTFYPAKKDGKLISVIAKTVNGKGYGGNISVLMSMTNSGIIENVVVTDNKETPGLGTAVFNRSIQKTIWGIIRGEYKGLENELPPNPTLDYLSGKVYITDSEYHNSEKNDLDFIPASKWKVEKDGGSLKYVTGATITSRAVTMAVTTMISVFDSNKAEIISKLSTEN